MHYGNFEPCCLSWRIPSLWPIYHNTFPNSFSPQIVTCLYLHQPWRGKKKGKSQHKEGASRERDLFRNEELEWKITKRRSNILASEPFLQFTCSFFLLLFSLAISRLPKCYSCWPPSVPGALSYKWTCQEALISPADQLALFIRSLTTHLPCYSSKWNWLLKTYDVPNHNRPSDRSAYNLEQCFWIWAGIRSPGVLVKNTNF